MDKEIFNELINEAQKGSKEEFLKFVTNIYNVDECIFEHIWKVPVIASSDGDTLVEAPLSSKTKEELIDIVDDFISNKLGDEYGCLISLDKMAEEFTEEELEEWKNKLDKGELKSDYNTIIVYNASQLQKHYKDLVKENSENTHPKTKEELNQSFMDYVKGLITSERCLLNANFIEIKENKYNDKRLNNYNSEKNKILIDILRKMINSYQDGDSIDDCLFRVIKEIDVKSQYENIESIEVLTMYTLFAEELTEWTIFGAYETKRENKLEKMIIEVCGTDSLLSRNQLNKKIEEYVTTLQEGTLSEKQIKMLEILGFSVNRGNKHDEESTKYLQVSNNKPSFIKRIYNWILRVFKK